MCSQAPANDNTSCTDSTGEPGACKAGMCQPVPTCGTSSSYPLNLGCGTTPTPHSNQPGTTDVTSIIDSYPCAPTEPGPEVAYTFKTGSADQDVTVYLHPSTPMGTTAAPVDKDLDLIVLDGTCTATSACMNKTVNGATQGVTAGTGYEWVTFHATADHTYYLVVDSKDMTQVTTFSLEVAACGLCQPGPGSVVKCNTSMYVGNTGNGTSVLGNGMTKYQCPLNDGSGLSGSVSAPGPEQAFLLSAEAPVNEVVHLSVSNGSNPFKIVALPNAWSGECAPSSCTQMATSTGSPPNTTASLTMNVSPNSKNWVVVDTDVSTATTFGLQYSCDPYCVPLKSIYCSSFSTPGSTTAESTGDSGSTSAWGPPGAACSGLTGLTGAENIYTVSGNGKTWNLNLKSRSTNKNVSLIVLDQGQTTSGACSPLSACATTAPQSGADVTGGYTTDQAHTLGASVNLTTVSGHTYLIVIDGTDDNVDFTLVMSSC
jgi:hypothetical protein